MPRRFSLVAFAVATPVALLAPPVWAQGGSVQPVRSQQADALPAVPSGIVRGEVLDAATAQPLASATVVLTPTSQTAVLPSRERAPGLSMARTTVTNAEGRYSFTNIGPGLYRLLVQRMGYRAVSLELSVTGMPEARVSVGLEVAPIRLETMRVESHRAIDSTPRLLGGAATDSSRAFDARARQARFLSADVRELTMAEASESVALIEGDLLRAFQRLPGVTTRDELSSELWVRGARWDLTRVTLDGMPLFAPFHASGVFTAFGADAIGSAVLFPGVRAASFGDGAAALLDLRTRPGGGDGRVRTKADVSSIGASLTLDQRSPDNRASWMLSGRRSFMDLWGWRSYLLAVQGSQPFTPDYFADLTGRADLSLGRIGTLEASGYMASDVLNADRSGEQDSYRSRNTAARLALVQPRGRFTARHTVAVSVASSDLRLGSKPADGELQYAAIRDTVTFWLLYPHLVLPANSRIAVASASSVYESSRRVGIAPAWSVGAELNRHDLLFDGYSRSWTVTEPSPSLRQREQLLVGSVWGERRWAPTPRITVASGLRVDASESLDGGSAVRPMPRFEVRLSPDSQTSLTAAAGRSWQYEQALQRTMFGNGAETMGSEMRWLLAGADIPALRSDIATLGVERWRGTGWLVSATAYARRTTGLLIADRTPGSVADRDTPIGAAERAHGIDVALRRFTGAVTGQLGYSFGRASIESGPLHFQAYQGRTHALDATASTALTKRLRVSTALSLATGSPYTRSPRQSNVDTIAFNDVQWLAFDREQEDPNVQRMPTYRSFDFMLDWAFRLGPARGSTYLQVRNALVLSNGVSYAGSGWQCTPYDSAASCRNGDFFSPGMRFSPVLGLRFRF